MRHRTLLLSLFLASSTVLAQSDGMLIFNADKPYVSPFDKPSAGEKTQQPPLMFPPTDRFEMPVQELPATSRGIILNPPVQKDTLQPSPAIKVAPPRKKVERKVLPVVKKEEVKNIAPKIEAKTVSAPKDSPSQNIKEASKKYISKKDEDKIVFKKEESKIQLPTSETAKEESIIPPKEAQNLKSVLAPPPALEIKENALTTFSEVPVEKAITKPTQTDSIALDDTVISKALVAPTPDATITTGQDRVEALDTREATSLPTWLLKALLFFIIGGLLMAGAWHWIKRQALYGDPAYQDPWFRPVKSR